MTNRASRKERVTARRQTQILGGAKAVFSRKGYTAATIPEIAEEAGVAAGTIYLYYPSKRDLFLAMVNQIVRGFYNFKIPEEDFSRGFEPLLKLILSNKLDVIRNYNVSSMMSLWSDIMREPALRQQLVVRFFEPVISQIEKFYRTRVHAGEFREIDPAIAARLLLGVIAGLALLNVFEGESGLLNRLSQDKLGSEVADILLNGLLKPQNNMRERN